MKGRKGPLTGLARIASLAQVLVFVTISQGQPVFHKVADDVGTMNGRFDTSFKAHADSFTLADDIVIARKVAESGPVTRTVTIGRLGPGEYSQTVGVYFEEYVVERSFTGSASGTVTTVIVSLLDAHGVPCPLRTRPNGTRVVAALIAPKDGVHPISGAIDPAGLAGEVLPAQPGEWVLWLSTPVTQDDFAPGVANINEAFLCTAVESLGQVPRPDAQRTLAMLMNLRGETVNSPYGTRVSRSLMGKLYSVDQRDKWMVLGTLRLWDMLGLRPELVPELVRVASDPVEWEQVPDWAKYRAASCLASGFDSHRAIDRMRLFSSPAEAIDAILGIVYEPLQSEFLELLPYSNFSGWAETRIGELWHRRTPAIESIMLARLPIWYGRPDKALQYTGFPPEATNRQELIDYWSHELGG